MLQSNIKQKFLLHKKKKNGAAAPFVPPSAPTFFEAFPTLTHSQFLKLFSFLSLLCLYPEPKTFREAGHLPTHGLLL